MELDKYELKHFLGFGSFGKVLFVINKEDNTECAMKMCNKGQGAEGVKKNERDVSYFLLFCIIENDREELVDD